MSAHRMLSSFTFLKFYPLVVAHSHAAKNCLAKVTWGQMMKLAAGYTVPGVEDPPAEV